MSVQGTLIKPVLKDWIVGRKGQWMGNSTEGLVGPWRCFRTTDARPHSKLGGPLVPLPGIIRATSPSRPFLMEGSLWSKNSV